MTSTERTLEKIEIAALLYTHEALTVILQLFTFSQSVHKKSECDISPQYIIFSCVIIIKYQIS